MLHFYKVEFRRDVFCAPAIDQIDRYERAETSYRDRREREREIPRAVCFVR